MRILPSIALVLAGSVAAHADDAQDRLKKAVDSLAARDGYLLDATWRMDIEKVQKPVQGTVDTVIRHKDDFVKLHGHFEDGDVTVYKKGDVIAAQNADTKEWGAASSDAKAKFVLKIFNLRTFLPEAADMAVNPRLTKGSKDEWLRIDFEADAAKLAKLLGDAEAGRALTNGTFEKATMKIELEVDRATGSPQTIHVTIEGDSKHAPKKEPVANGAAAGIKDWGDDEDKKEPGAPNDPKKKDPKPEPKPGDDKPLEPVTEHVKVSIEATLDYKGNLDITLPEGARKVLGM